MIVDLRSDTVTRPTPEMYEAMASAPLGDDVLGDEPTVTKLELIAAEMLGKEAAVYVPSGTMGNQIALASHCQPGDAVIVEEQAHLLYYELGTPGIVASVVTWTLPSLRGVMDPDLVESHILRRSDHTPGTALLCVENTHNRAGGTIVPIEAMRAYREIADERDIRIHLDGARVFNAAVALDVPVREIAKYADSVSFCLSKGLRSPVGSVLCGTSEFIQKARIWRKRLGGGMRQAGVIAACGIVSLTKYVDRLADDHRRARALAQAVSEIPGLRVDWDTVQTNMVLVTTDEPASAWQDWLHEKDVWCFSVAPHRLRLVLHADVDDQGVERATEALRQVARVRG